MLSATRLVVVRDIYILDNVKEPTRAKRGKDVRWNMSGET